MLFGQKFPKSEASEHKVKYADMLKEVGFFGAMIICFLLALWFQNLCGALNLPQWIGWAGRGFVGGVRPLHPIFAGLFSDGAAAGRSFHAGLCGVGDRFLDQQNHRFDSEIR